MRIWPEARGYVVTDPTQLRALKERANCSAILEVRVASDTVLRTHVVALAAMVDLKSVLDRYMEGRRCSY